MKVDNSNFQPNEKPTKWKLGDDTILVEVENSLRGLYWRMTVNEKQSKVSRDYHGILVHEGYGLVTAYWGEPREFVPFQINYVEGVK